MKNAAEDLLSKQQECTEFRRKIEYFEEMLLELEKNKKIAANSKQFKEAKKFHSDIQTTTISKQQIEDKLKESQILIQEKESILNSETDQYNSMLETFTTIEREAGIFFFFFFPSFYL